MTKSMASNIVGVAEAAINAVRSLFADAMNDNGRTARLSILIALTGGLITGAIVVVRDTDNTAAPVPAPHVCLLTPATSK